MNALTYTPGRYVRSTAEAETRLANSLDVKRTQWGYAAQQLGDDWAEEEQAGDRLRRAARWWGMMNRAMRDALEKGECVDLSSCERSAAGYYIIPLDVWQEDVDYCDAETEAWIWSIGRAERCRRDSRELVRRSISEPVLPLSISPLAHLTATAHEDQPMNTTDDTKASPKKKPHSMVYRHIYVAKMEDGASPVRGYVRCSFRDGETKTAFSLVPIQWVSTLRQAQRKEWPLKITTEGPKDHQKIVNIEYETTPHMRVIQAIDDSGAALSTGSFKTKAGHGLLERFVVKHSGVVLVVEETRGGGVEVYAPLSRSISIDDLMNALGAELDPLWPKAGEKITDDKIQPASVEGIDLGAGDDTPVEQWRCLYCHDALDANEICNKDECLRKREAARRSMGVQPEADATEPRGTRPDPL